MTVVKLREGEEYIKLGQALKAAGLVQMGSESKMVITQGLVLVNGEKELRRGRKLYAGDQAVYQGQTITIER